MSRLHPEDVTLHHHADRDTDVTDLVPIDTPTKAAIAHACHWDVRHGTARLNGRQVQQMADLVALVEGHEIATDCPLPCEQGRSGQRVRAERGGDSSQDERGAA